MELILPRGNADATPVCQKIFVAVDVRFSPTGQMTPKAIHWSDGRRFPIDEVTDMRKAASLKAGGRGIRYTCLIEGKQRYLFFEDPRWFVEGKPPS